MYVTKRLQTHKIVVVTVVGIIILSLLAFLVLVPKNTIDVIDVPSDSTPIPTTIPTPTVIPTESPTPEPTPTESITESVNDTDVVLVPQLVHNINVTYWDKAIPNVMPSSLFAIVSGSVSNIGNGTARNVNVTVHFYYLGSWTILASTYDWYNVTIPLYSIEPMSTANIYREYNPLLSIEHWGLCALRYEISIEYE